jgi:hypothetical protein
MTSKYVVGIAAAIVVPFLGGMLYMKHLEISHYRLKRAAEYEVEAQRISKLKRDRETTKKALDE